MRSMKEIKTEKQTYKETLERLCGCQISDEEAFDALNSLTELIILLNDIDLELKKSKAQATHTGGAV